MLERDPTLPDRLGPVDSFALSQVLEDLTCTGDLFFFATRLVSQVSDIEPKDEES